MSAVGSHRLSSDKEGTRAVAREKRTNETMLYRMARKVKRLKRLMGFDEYIPGRGGGKCFLCRRVSRTRWVEMWY